MTDSEITLGLLLKPWIESILPDALIVHGEYQGQQFVVARIVHYYSGYSVTKVIDGWNEITSISGISGTPYAGFSDVFRITNSGLVTALVGLMDVTIHTDEAISPSDPDYLDKLEPLLRSRWATVEENCKWASHIVLRKSEWLPLLSVTALPVTATI